VPAKFKTEREREEFLRKLLEPPREVPTPPSQTSSSGTTDAS